MAPRRTNSVQAAVRRDLGKLVPELQDTAEAAVALELAKTIDQGLTMTTCSRELRAVMAALRTADVDRRQAAAPQEIPEPAAAPKRGVGVVGLADRAARRRGAAAS